MGISTVVTISRQFGSGGAYVGREVARRLGLQYADRDILARAAQTLNVGTDDVEPLEERVRGFWERLGTLFAQASPDAPYLALPQVSVSGSELFAVEREIIETLAEHGGAVIVGRGAAHILSGRPDVIRVFLHAPFSMRVALAIKEYELTDRELAEAMVRSSDAQRARFVRTLTGRDWCDATLYDVSLNTATAGLERAVDLVIDMIQRPADPTRPDVRPRAADGRSAS